MRIAKKKRLEAASWTIGTADEFLGLSPEEAEIVEVSRSSRREHAAGGVEDEPIRPPASWFRNQLA